jgi:hypothetical protein
LAGDKEAGERLDDFRVKLSSGAPSQFCGGSIKALSGMINANAGHCVEGISDGEDPGIAIDLVATQTERVTLSIPSLMVLTND